MGEERLLTENRVCFSRSMVQEDLIVSKVVAGVKHEKLILFPILQTYNSFTPTYHKDLVKHFSSPHNYLVSYVYPASQLRNHLTEKVLACLLLLI